VSGDKIMGRAAALGLDDREQRLFLDAWTAWANWKVDQKNVGHATEMVRKVDSLFSSLTKAMEDKSNRDPSVRSVVKDLAKPLDDKRRSEHESRG